MNKFAPLLLDSYKISHRRQYTPSTRTVFSTFTPRGSRVPGVNKVVFFGLQYFLKEYLQKNWNESFFSQPVDLVVKKYADRLFRYVGPNNEGEQHIRDLHALGYLPLEIWALPEGSAVDLRVPMFVMWNTSPDKVPDAVFAWITNSLETILSATIWLPCTSATTAKMYKEILDKGAAETNSAAMEFVPWQGHDFSFRGHTSFESAVLSGAGHALFFTGSDTVPVQDFFDEFYTPKTNGIVVGSCAATEHSVACTGIAEYEDKISGMTQDEINEFANSVGYFAREVDPNRLAEYLVFNRLITEVYPNGLVSCVSDSFDFWSVVDPEDGILVHLKDKILARDGKVVIRPDSGDPVKIVTGYTIDEISVNDHDEYIDLKTGKILSENEVKGMIQCLWDIFGGTETAEGFNQLDPHIGAIYGDAITLERAQQIIDRLKQKGFASTNIVFGIGSFTYQGAVTPEAILTRDTYGFAVKSTYCEVLDENGNLRGIDILKDPKTDDGLKKSAKGLTAVYRDGDKFVLKDQATWDEVKNCEFVQVFSNGRVTKEWSLEEVRTNAQQ